MSLPWTARKGLAILGLAGAVPVFVLGQSTYAPQGSEYSPAGTLPGDQMFPQVSVNRSGGYLVWQDNATDGDGWGISAQRLDRSLSGTLGAFRINDQGAGDQEHPQVTLLAGGGAVFVWQGGPQGSQHVFARFLKPDGTFVTGDVMVNTYTNSQQINPVVASLADSNVVVAWSSFDQDGSLQGVFAQRLSPTGVPVGGEFQVNQFTRYNQRSPALAALSNGNFVVVWVSEQQRFENSVDLFARLYNPTGAPLSDEFLVNSTTNVCADPSVAASPDGGFAVAWSQVNISDPTNNWDVWVKVFDATGSAAGPEVEANTHTVGRQYAPQIRSLSSDYLVVWTSLGQDGSREGVYGRFLTGNGIFSSDEFRVNTTTISRQMQPAAASDGVGRFIAVWTSYVGGAGRFDLFGQRYASAQPIPQPAPPFVSALSQSRLSVTWPNLAGFAVDHYELYVDQGTTPISVTNNYTVVSNLLAGTTHAFRLAYQLADGRRSTVSDPASGTTWGEDLTGPNGVPDGLPDDWEAKYFGPDPSKWPSPSADSDGDGATNIQEFLAGTNPTDATSVLRMQITHTSEGWRLNWNTQAGSIYQVQTTTNFTTWSDVGSPRLAAGSTDSIPIGGPGGAVYYRVIRQR